MANDTGRVLSVNVGGVLKFEYHGPPGCSEAADEGRPAG